MSYHEEGKRNHASETAKVQAEVYAINDGNHSEHCHAPAGCTYYLKEYDGQIIFKVSGFKDNCWYGELPGS